MSDTAFYILSNGQSDIYKIGIHTGPVNTLFSQNRIYYDPILIAFIPHPNPRLLLERILFILDHKRIKHNLRKTEWIQCKKAELLTLVNNEKDICNKCNISHVIFDPMEVDV